MTVRSAGPSKMHLVLATIGLALLIGQGACIWTSMKAATEAHQAAVMAHNAAQLAQMADYEASGNRDQLSYLRYKLVPSPLDR